MTPQLLWIGLGNMGRPMCKNLIGKGSLSKPLLVYNRTKQRTDDFLAQVDSSSASSLETLEASVGQANVIFTCLSNDAAVIETYKSIVSSGDIRNMTLIDCSTIHPDSANKVAELIAGSGAEFVTSPVFGPPHMAEEGSLIFVPAGPKSAIEKLRPYIGGVMGRAEIPFEDQPHGSASKFKLICNTFVLNALAQLAETYTLAEKSGIDPKMIKSFVDKMYGGIYTTYSERMLEGTYWKMEEPFMSAANGLKDVTHVLSLAGAAGVELRNATAGRDYLQQVADIAGGDKGDVAGIYGAVRKASGLEYQNDV